MRYHVKELRYERVTIFGREAGLCITLDELLKKEG